MKTKWGSVPSESPVWIDHVDKPVVNIFLVRDVPERPTGLEIRTTWDRNTVPDGQPELYLAQHYT